MLKFLPVPHQPAMLAAMQSRKQQPQQQIFASAGGPNIANNSNSSSSSQSFIKVAAGLVGLQLLFTASVCVGVAFSPSAVASVANAATAFQSRNKMAAWVVPFVGVLASLLFLRLLLLLCCCIEDDCDSDEDPNSSSSSSGIITIATKSSERPPPPLPQLLTAMLLLLLSCSLAVFAAWVAASAVCDPLVRAVWVRSAAPEEQQHTALPLSVVFKQRARSEGKAVAWLIEDEEPYLTSSMAFCTTNEVTLYMAVGRHSVAMGCVLATVTFPLAVASALSLPTRPLPSSIVKPKLKRKQQAALAARQAKAAVGTSAVTAAAMALVAIISMNDNVWDWRPIYAGLLAFGASAYLSAAFVFAVAHAHSMAERRQSQGGILTVMAFMWLQLPLLLEHVLVFLVCGIQ